MPQPTRTSPPLSHWLQWVILALGIVAAGLAFHLSREEINAGIEHRFHSRSDSVIAGISQKLEAYTEVLRGIHFNVNENPTLLNERFRRFFEQLQIHQRLPGIEGIGFSKRVVTGGMSQEPLQFPSGDPQYKSLLQVAGTEAGAPEDAYVIVYVEPFEKHTVALGFDQFGEPRRKLAMRRARDSADIVAAGPVRLNMVDENNTGALFFMPVYAGNRVPDTVAERRQAIIGFVFLAVQLHDVLRSAMGPELLQGLDVRIAEKADARAGAAFQEAHYFYRSSQDASGPSLPWGPAAPVLAQSYALPFSGGTWEVEVSAPAELFETQNRWLPAALALAVLSLACIAFFLVRHFEWHHHRLRRRQRDISATLQLRERAIEASANAVVICNAINPDFPVEYVNPAFERMTGYSPDDIIGKNLRILHRDDTNQPGLNELRAIIREKKEGHVTLRNYRKDGSLFWTDIRIAPVKDEQGEVTHFVAAKYDVTETREYQQELEYQASHDPLTGLPNRALFTRCLLERLQAGSPAAVPFWVAFVDLDRFKIINDTMGHTAGDELLKEVSRRLKRVMEGSGVVARHGGDEFILILDGENGTVPGIARLQRIMDELMVPISVHEQEFVVSSSIGIAVYPDNGNDPETLIRNADMAMYRAKDIGRNTFQFYSAHLNDEVQDRLYLESGLRTAVERGELELHYQPQASLQNDCLVGMEALVRWNHPQLGQVSPFRFIGIAEDTGLIVPIGYWILRTACRQNKLWQEMGLPRVPVAVNVSSRQFADQNFSSVVLETLAETGLEPQYLELELTESLLMDNLEHAVSVLASLKQIGVRISIDDFGTGYSSLAYLKQFPMDTLKIDRSFVRDVPDDAEDAAIVDAIISLAHSLRLRVVAEGVEHESQVDYLKAHRCDKIQGYYYSRPLDGLGMEAFLTSRELQAA